MLKELETIEQIGHGDFMAPLRMLGQTASALAQLMPTDEEMQQAMNTVNPPDVLAMERAQAQGQAKDNYNNPDLSPRPGR